MNMNIVLRIFYCVVIALIINSIAVSKVSEIAPPQRNPIDRNVKLLEMIFNRQMRSFSLASTTVTVTAYSAREEETDSTPHITADNTLATVGRVAVSRDMLDYLNYGDRIVLPTFGVFVVSDTMNRRFVSRVDILMAHPLAAKKFGIHKNERLIFIFN